MNSIYTNISDETYDRYTSSKKIKALNEVLMSEKADYRLAKHYADEISKIWSNALLDNLAPFEQLTEELARETIQPAMLSEYDRMTEVCDRIQTNLNKRSGISLKAQKPDIEWDRIDNLIDKITEDFTENIWLLGDDVQQNWNWSIANNSIQKNANFQRDSGLRPTVERDTGTGCCAWCESIAGKYIYGEQPKDFFAVHKDCTCDITYTPRSGKVQKIRYETVGNRIQKIID